MRSVNIFFIFSFFLAFSLNAQDYPYENDAVEVIKDFSYLYRYQNYYLGGQPTLEALKWLKSQGVKKIVNFRTKQENNEFAASAYHEKSNAKELGFEYHSIPINGIIDYKPKKLDVFLSHINNNEKIFIHCRTGGRVTHFFMAYLIKNEEYTVNEAVNIGKDLRFFFPLEDLLDIEISMETME